MLAVAGAIGGLLFFNARDDATTTAAVTGPGVAVPAQTGAAAARLRKGNVELHFGDAGDGAALTRLAEALSGPLSQALLDAGQAVVVVREPGLHGIRAVAWRRELTAQTPQDPRVRTFAEFWLGRGAPR